MLIKAKYKIARRVGAPVFEKTQGQKFILSKNRKAAARAKQSKHPRQKSEYGLGMIEKQKARYTYIVNERQFSNYVKAAIAKKGTDSAQMLFESLEMRLDNVVYRIGFANPRLFSRQMVGHGHVTVNSRRTNIPSFRVSVGDVIKIREGSLIKKMFENLPEKLKEHATPLWIKFDPAKNEATIVGHPKFGQGDILFNLNKVLEFYTR